MRASGADAEKGPSPGDPDGVTVAIDELEDGTLLAEIDDQDGPPVPVPGWLDVLRDVTDDEEWTGARLAR